MDMKDNPEFQALNRAIQALTKCDLDKEARQAGQTAIHEKMISLANAGKRGRKGQRQPYLDSPEFGVLYAYVTDQMPWREAVDSIMSIRHIGDKAAEAYIKKWTPMTKKQAYHIEEIMEKFGNR